MNALDLKTLLCNSLCEDVALTEMGQGEWRVGTPLRYPDGDGYLIYLRHSSDGSWRITDKGSTLMHLSYENDVGKFREGGRARLFNQIIADTGLEEDDGEFFLSVPADELSAGLFLFGQAMTRLHDLTFLNRLRMESTFYEDLREFLKSTVDESRLHEGYIVEGVPRAADYPVDYFIEGGQAPLYLFGVPNRDKARLATIILQHLTGSGREFNSLVVFQNMADIPARDLSRLTNSANDMIDSLDAQSDLERKLLRRIR